jgi:hypothetical protein
MGEQWQLFLSGWVGVASCTDDHFQLTAPMRIKLRLSLFRFLRREIFSLRSE